MQKPKQILSALDYKKTVDFIEAKKALCPSCKKRLERAGGVYVFSGGSFHSYYAICEKCEEKRVGKKAEDLDKIISLTESNLQKNPSIYASKIIEKPNLNNLLDEVNRKNKKEMKINSFDNLDQPWHKVDIDFFEKNPDRKFFARKLIIGELSETNKNRDDLKQDAINKNISFALVHKLANQHRIYTYVSDLSGHPYEEEAFVAAMFMVKFNDLLSESDIYDMYEQIKKNAKVIEDFNLSDLMS